MLGTCLMTAGGWCYVKIPRGTWVTHLPGMVRLRAAPHHLGLGLTLSFMGLALLTWAWWDLCRWVRGDALGVGRVWRTTAAWVVPLILAPPLFSGDGWSYVATGYLAGHGQNPYVVPPAALPLALRSGVSLRWVGTPTPYGPLSIAWGGLWSRVTSDPWALLASYRLLALLGLVMVAVAVPALSRRCGRDPALASALVVASPFMLAHGVGGLHNDLVMCALMLLALVLTDRGVWCWGAVLAGAAAAVKIPGGLVAVGVVLLSLGPAASVWRRCVRTAQVGCVATAALGVLSWGSRLGFGWWHALTVPAAERTPLSVTAMVGGWARARLLHAGADGTRLVHELHPIVLAKHLGMGTILVVALWVLLRRRVGETNAALAGTGAVLLVATVLGPAVHFWYALWCVPLLGCVRLRPGPSGAYVGFVVALGLAAPADPSLHLSWLTSAGTWLMVVGPCLGFLVGGWLTGPGRGGRRLPTAPIPRRSGTTAGSVEEDGVL